jgi:hypothetical protein
MGCRCNPPRHSLSWCSSRHQTKCLIWLPRVVLCHHWVSIVGNKKSWQFTYVQIQFECGWVSTRPQYFQRPVFSNMSWSPGLNFVPSGEFSPLRSLPGVNTPYSSEEPRGEQRIFATRENYDPRGQISPLVANFTPVGCIRLQGRD